MMMTKSNNNFSSIKDLIKGQTRMKGGGAIQPSSPTSVMEFPQQRQQQQRQPTTTSIRPSNKNSKKLPLNGMSNQIMAIIGITITFTRPARI